jgi:hypothetical protein
MRSPVRLDLLFGVVMPTGGVGFKDHSNFITHTAKDGELFFLSAGGIGWIIETPMIAVHLTGEHWASLVGVAADGDDGFNLLLEEIVHVFGMVCGNINADFVHHLNREGVDIVGRFTAGAGNAEFILGRIAQNALRDVAAAGIAGAKDKDQRNVRFHDRFRQRAHQ